VRGPETTARRVRIAPRRTSTAFATVIIRGFLSDLAIFVSTNPNRVEELPDAGGVDAEVQVVRSRFKHVPLGAILAT
jgi:hypothetical protein